MVLILKSSLMIQPTITMIMNMECLSCIFILIWSIHKIIREQFLTTNILKLKISYYLLRSVRQHLMGHGLIQKLKSIVPHLVINILFMEIITLFLSLGSDLLFNFVTLKKEHIKVSNARIRKKLKSILATH